MMRFTILFVCAKTLMYFGITIQIVLNGTAGYYRIHMISQTTTTTLPLTTRSWTSWQTTTWVPWYWTHTPWPTRSWSTISTLLPSTVPSRLFSTLFTIKTTTKRHVAYTRTPHTDASSPQFVPIVCVVLGSSIGLVVILTVVTLYIDWKRKHKQNEINCAAAPLDAAKWDLLIVADAKDALMMVSEEVINALGRLVPKPKVKRTNVHRLYIETGVVRCKTVIFLICNGYTSVQDCCEKIIPRLHMEKCNCSTVKVFLFDSDCQSFAEWLVSRDDRSESFNSTIKTEIDSCWLLPLLQLVLKPKSVKSISFSCHVIGNGNSAIQTCKNKVIGQLGAFGIKVADSGDKVKFRILFAHNIEAINSRPMDTCNSLDYIFLTRQRPEDIPSNLHRTFARDEILTGIVCMLSEFRVIDYKFTFRREPHEYIV